MTAKFKSTGGAQFVPVRVSLAIAGPDGYTMVEKDGWVTLSAPGLAVCKCHKLDDYEVLHVASGRSVIDSFIKRKVAADCLLELAASGLDWTQGYDTLAANGIPNELYETLRKYNAIKYA